MGNFALDVSWKSRSIIGRNLQECTMAFSMKQEHNGAFIFKSVWLNILSKWLCKRIMLSGKELPDDDNHNS